MQRAVIVSVDFLSIVDLEKISRSGIKFEISVKVTVERVAAAALRLIHCLEASKSS